jgi:hypothetical protein
MEVNYLEHCNIQSLKHLFKNFSKETLLAMKSLTLSNEEIAKFPPASTLQIFRSLEELHMRNCKLNSFPADSIVKSMPLLKKIDISGNSILTISEILPLGDLTHLEDLNLSGNPIRLLEHRISLIQALIFPEQSIKLKYLSCLNASTKVLPKKREKKFAGSNSVTHIVLNKSKPAKVPREGKFPMLRVVNGKFISEEELKSAKPYLDDDIIVKNEQKEKAEDPILEKVRLKNKKILAKRDKYIKGLFTNNYHPCTERKQSVEHVPRYFKVDPLKNQSHESSPQLSDSSLTEENEDELEKVHTFNTTEPGNFKLSHTQTVFYPDRSETVAPSPPINPNKPVVPRLVSPLLEFRKQKTRNNRETLLSTVEFTDRERSKSEIRGSHSLPRQVQESPPQIKVRDETYRQRDEEENKEIQVKIHQLIERSKKLREEASCENPPKIYTFEEVSNFLYKREPNGAKEISTVSGVLHLLNNTRRKIEVASDAEIRRKLDHDLDNVNLEEFEIMQNIIEIQTDIESMQPKSATLDWWLNKIEKKQLKLAEHKAILTLHKRRVFGDPKWKMAGSSTWQKEFLPSKKVILPHKADNSLEVKIPANKQIGAVYRMAENHLKRTGREIYEKPDYLPRVNYRGLLKECYPNIDEIMEKPRQIIKPIQTLEQIMEQYELKMREKEKEFEALSYDEKVWMKLTDIKRNIAEREKMRENLEHIMVQVHQLMSKFMDHNKKYYSNHEKEEKVTIHDYLKKKDFILHAGSKYSVSRLLNK